jgi:hypothetical protein
MQPCKAELTSFCRIISAWRCVTGIDTSIMSHFAPALSLNSRMVPLQSSPITLPCAILISIAAMSCILLRNGIQSSVSGFRVLQQRQSTSQPCQRTQQGSFTCPNHIEFYYLECKHLVSFPDNTNPTGWCEVYPIVCYLSLNYHQKGLCYFASSDSGIEINHRTRFF